MDGKIKVKIYQALCQIKIDLPDGREKEIIIQKLEESLMWLEHIDWWSDEEEEDNEIYQDREEDTRDS